MYRPEGHELEHEAVPAEVLYVPAGHTVHEIPPVVASLTSVPELATFPTIAPAGHEEQLASSIAVV